MAQHSLKTSLRPAKGNKVPTVPSSKAFQDVKLNKVRAAEGLKPTTRKLVVPVSNDWGRNTNPKGSIPTHKAFNETHRKIRVTKNLSLDVPRHKHPPRGRPVTGHKVDRKDWFKTAPTKFQKELILNFLRSDLINRNHIMREISSRLNGIVYYSKWVYKDSAPYMDFWNDWFKVKRLLPFQLVKLVLRQLAFIPSSLDLGFFRRMKSMLNGCG